MNEENWNDIFKRFQDKQNNEVGAWKGRVGIRNDEPVDVPRLEPKPQPEPIPEPEIHNSTYEPNFTFRNDTEPVEPDVKYKPEPKIKPAMNWSPPPNNRHNNGGVWDMLGITQEEFQELLRFKANHEKRSQIWIFLIGVIFMPVTLAGALLGYVRGYNRFMKSKRLLPNFYPMRPIVRIAMIIGAVLAWLCLAAFAVFVYATAETGANERVLLGYFVVNAVLSGIVYGLFKRWQTGANNVAWESHKFGSARFASKDELFTLKNKKGYYLGQGHLFDDFGHLLTVAGTRGGKGTNIIIPNLLGAGDVETSWVVIDPKGENAAITARYQRKNGQKVVVLNPWGLLSDNIGDSQSYNPLDMIEVTSIHFVDDVQIIAEMIVPVDKTTADPFWSDCARSVVVGLLLFILTEKPEEERTLGTLWELARLPEEDWDKLIQDMGASMHRQHKKLLNNAANEILKLQQASSETFGGIMANVLQATDFLKSAALQKGLQSGLDPTTLSDGKTTVYVIIPADKLSSHSRWLRLVVTSLMRAVIRKPNKRVTFLLDEFAALGYISEIEVALSTYAGYNVTVWPILQTLVQLENLYANNWQTFISNCTVRQFFSINDMFSASYVSEAIGHTSHVATKRAWFGVQDAESSERLLITPDELRRESGKRIFMFIADLPPTYIEKLPYYKVPELQTKADKNPYIS